MKYVLGILGLAVAFIVLSLILSPPKDLRPEPQNKEPAAGTDMANKPKDVASGSSTPVASAPPDEGFNAPREGVITAVMTIKGRGDVTMEFYPKAAPKTVAQFTGLIKKGFYNGILFHRVEPPLVVQVGNPLTKTQGVDAREGDGAAPPIPFEDNKLQHVTGAVGVALKAPRSDTGDSQLFIDLEPHHMWDGEYCVIGRVTKGMDVVNKIQRGDPITKFVIQ
jgi:cyclophilin family peptidyl-prolyl cis-trans isomerase